MRKRAEERNPPRRDENERESNVYCVTRAALYVRRRTDNRNVTTIPLKWQ